MFTQLTAQEARNLTQQFYTDQESLANKVLESVTQKIRDAACAGKTGVVVPFSGHSPQVESHVVSILQGNRYRVEVDRCTDPKDHTDECTLTIFWSQL